MKRVARLLPVCVLGLAGSIAATQSLAHAFHRAPELGAPLLTIGDTPVYSPFEWYTWRQQWGRYSPRAFAVPTALATLGPVLGLLIAMGLQGRRRPEPTGAYGTARWATADEIRKAGLLGERGIVLGQVEEAEFKQQDDARWVMTKTSRLLRYDGDGHTFVCARTRAGKGITSVIPTLLSYTEGSVLVHDPKGENWELTAGWRSLFSHCLRLEPTAENSVKFNPLFTVRPAPLDVRDAQNVAEILVNPESMSEEQRDHWKLTGHAFLVGVILHVLYAEPEKSLPGVLRVLTDPERPFEELLHVMMQTRHLPSGPHPTVAGAARAMLDRSENERSGVKSTATSFLEIYRDPLMAANTSTSDFTISDLMCAERPVSLYLVVPTSDIERTRPVIRLLLNVIGRRLTEHLHHVDDGPGMVTGGPETSNGPPPPRRSPWWRKFWKRHSPSQTESGADGRLQKKRRELLCLIDEFPQLGRIPFFANGLSYIAGYRLKCLLVAQSFKQLEEVYGRSNSVLDNCINRVTYGTTCDHTAERISRLLGTQSLVKLQISTSSRPGMLAGVQESRTYQEYGRPLKTVDEVLSMPFPDAIILAG